MKDCLVSFASKGREDYRYKLMRLIDSAVQHWKGDYLIYSPDHDYTIWNGVTIHRGCPRAIGIESFNHQQMPYQFKTVLIQKAIEEGYDRVVWLDSGMTLQKDITPLFGKTGVTVFENLGHPLYKYISGDAVKLLGDPDIYNIPQIWGGALFFDFTKNNAVNVFAEIKKFSVNGSFKDGGSIREGFVAHRHDQAVMSVLVHGKCDMLAYGNIVCPPHDTTFEYGKDFYLISK